MTSSSTLDTITRRYLHHHQSSRAYHRLFAVNSRVIQHRYRLSARRRADLGRLYLTHDLAAYMRDQYLLKVPHWFEIGSVLDPRGLIRVRHVATRKIFVAEPLSVPSGMVVRGFLNMQPDGLATAETVRIIWFSPAATQRLVARHLAHHTSSLTLRGLARTPGVATVVQVAGPRRDRDQLVFSPRHALWRLFYGQPPRERFVVLNIADPLDVQIAQAFGCPVGKVWEIQPGVWTVATRKRPDPALAAVVGRALNVTLRI